MLLPGYQDDLISAVAAANPNTVVVLNTGDPVFMPWVDSVKAILEMWYPGQMGGPATADLLLGNANPGFLGTSPHSYRTIDFTTNGIFVGYRWYNGISFVNDLIDGGHEWYVWRQNLYDFASTIAFRHTTTSLSQVSAPGSSGGRHVVFVTATVQAVTTEPARPTGKVQFYLDGQKLDPARPVLPDGTAKQALPQLSPGPHTVTAVYSGDNFYNSSSSKPLAVNP
jgi:Glycosyl hydrolase family 3 C-terminal domain/Bacterial Ig-like domain (group 3)